MYQLIILLHVFTCVALIALVLIQQGKGATIGAAFGSGASQTVFGSQGSGSFMLKLTGSIAAIFFATSLLLGAMATYQSKHAQTSPMSPISMPSSDSQSTAPSEKVNSTDVPTVAKDPVEKSSQPSTEP